MEMSDEDYLEESASGGSTSGADAKEESSISRPPDQWQKNPKPKLVTLQDSSTRNRKVKMSSKRNVSRDNLFQRSSSSLAHETQFFECTESFDMLESFEQISPTTLCVWPQHILVTAIDELLITKSPLIVRLCKPLLNVSFDESVWQEIPGQCRDIGVLFACLNGHVAMLTCFLGLGGDANASDLVGRRALHYAASSTSPTALHCINVLVNRGATIDLFDSNAEATPLFCAAASGRIELVEAFLNNGSNVNAEARETSALVWAVRARSLVCVARLIEAGANVNNVQVYSESPIHVAAFLGDIDCLKLLLEKNADIGALCGPERMNALHLASLKGNVECIQLLLQTSTADIDKQEAVGRTALHLAALAQSKESVKLLLDNGARHDICDGMKETPLHSAVVKCRHRSIDVVRLLVSAGANVNMKNQFGQTPLHLAAINEHSKLASFLILSGADLSAKNRGNNSAMALVVRRVPEALSAISRKLDSAVEIAGLDPTDADCELRLDLQVLVPSGDQQKVGEMAMLTSLIAADQRHMLQHPVIEAFLHLKWLKIRATFVFSLIFQLCYVLSLTLNIYTTYVFNWSDETKTTLDNQFNNSINSTIQQFPIQQSKTNSIPDSFWFLTVIFGSMTACKELFQLYCNPLEYVRDKMNYAHIFSVVGMGLILPHQGKEAAETEWKHHVAAIVIIVTWINLMMHIGRFPVFGLYVQMFTTVAWNMSKLLVTYICLIIGFALGFAVLFPGSIFFCNLHSALLATIIMMTGEIDYNTLFFDEKDHNNTLCNGDKGKAKMKFEGTAHFVFLSFVLLVVIVLMNLLVGLAVSDIQGLLNSACLDRVVRVTKQIARMEIFIFFPWRIRFPKISTRIPKRERLQRKVLVVSPKAKRTYNFKPNDPRDRRFPPNIKENLLAIAVKRMANKKKRPLQIPTFQTMSTVQVDDFNGEVIANVLNRVDELFKNYMSEIVMMNKAMNEKLARVEDANRNRTPLARAWKPRPCDRTVIPEEFSHCDSNV